MVKSLIFIKSKYFLKRELVLAITMIVVVFSFSANFAFAAQTKISAQEVERVKIALDIIGTTSKLGNIFVDGGGLMKALNTVIRGGQTATDVTYGLLVLSAINEMEFMDMVLSQAYKDEARDYFNQILDERTSLRSYWKGVGFDIPKVLSGRITSPMGGLTLNTFEMTDKIVLIFTEFEVLKRGRQYDGLWRYFDERMHGESHQGAWELAEPQIGWAANSVGFHGVGQRQKQKVELEQQFASLWEKWGPYATSQGISKEYKEQLASELRTTLVSAIEENTDIGSLYVAEERSVWDKFAAQLASIKNALGKIIAQVNPFKAGPLVGFPAETVPLDTVSAEDGSPPVSEPALIDEAQEDLDDLLEQADIELAEPAEITEAITIEPVAAETEPKIEIAPATTTAEATIDVKEIGPPSIKFCQRGAGGAPRQYRVLINEVAWMGSQDSPNNEWIELRNIWGIPVNLAGWQLQDKDQQIKIIFGENDAIPAGGYHLIYTSYLYNSDEALYLFDNNCQLEDEVLANPNWPAGDNADKKTMQRFDVLYWYTGLATAGSKNNSPPAFLTHPSAPLSEEKIPKILITEVQIEGTESADHDFIELYNPNDKNADISNWQLKKKTSTGAEYSVRVFPGGSFIPAKGYFVWANYGAADTTSTQTLAKNNSLALFDKKGNVVDQVAWGSSTNPFVENQQFPDNPDDKKNLGRKWSTTTQSYADTDNNAGDFELQNATKRAQNQSLAPGGTTSLKVAINEIAWMGTKAKSPDEWIELYNNTTSSINLAGWRLVADDGGPDITFPTSTISAGGYFLIERTDDNAVSNISADWFGSFGSGLNNNGEIVKLYDNLGNLIDSLDFFSGWPTGQASPNYVSMERINSVSSSDANNWASNNKINKNGRDAENNYINGTPKAQNTVSKSFTEVEGGLDLYENFTLTYLGSPYSMMGKLYVRPNVKLTIESGVIVKFKNNPYWQSLFQIEGQLEATGVTLTSSSTEPLAGDWQGMHFNGSSGSILENVIIKYADTVKIEGGQVSIKNSTIEKSQSYGLWIINSSPEISSSTFSNNNKFSYTSGIYVGDASSTPVIASSTFTGNKIGITAENKAKPQITGNIFKENEYPIKVSSAYPYLSGNSAQNNINGDSVFFTGIIFQDAVWQSNLPYIVENPSTIAEGAKLTIAPGAVVKMNGGSNMLVNGTLLAQGTEGNQIIFTSITDSDPENNGGYYIYLNPSSKNSVLNNVAVRYGGFHINDFAGYRAAITIENTTSTISNAIIENNFFAGVQLINSTSTIQNTIFRDNKVKYSNWGLGSYSRGLSILNSAPNITSSHFERNYHGVYIDGDCPDLSGATFGTGANANTINVSCSP